MPRLNSDTFAPRGLVPITGADPNSTGMVHQYAISPTSSAKIYKGTLVKLVGGYVEPVVAADNSTGSGAITLLGVVDQVHHYEPADGSDFPGFFNGTGTAITANGAPVYCNVIDTPNIDFAIQADAALGTTDDPSAFTKTGNSYRIVAAQSAATAVSAADDNLFKRTHKIDTYALDASATATTAPLQFLRLQEQFTNVPGYKKSGADSFPICVVRLRGLMRSQ